MRWLVYSDIHGNCEALQAVWEAAREQFDESICLGDIVGYGASPNEATDWVRGHTGVVIRGNHDRVCAQAEGWNEFNPTAREAAMWTHQQLRPDNRQWIAELPTGPLRRGNLLLAHGSPRNEDEYILAGYQAARLLEAEAPRIVLIGHTHLQGGWVRMASGEVRPLLPPREPSAWQARPEQPFSSVRQVVPLQAGCRYVINPGSVGQPRDRDWRAAFVLIEDEPARLTFVRVPYDLARARDRILEAGLPSALAFRLERGQ